MHLERWKSQLRKGAAEMAVLALLLSEERYGLEITKILQRFPGLEISDGTLYPLLNRLQRAGKIRSTWRHDEDAVHPRKYYRITDDGRTFFGEMRQAWRLFASDLTALMEEAKHEAGPK